ncbi:MAG: amidase, partial [Myxococcaceae bacterium]|nr:amidase [Myxococcaceae bacterium]
MFSSTTGRAGAFFRGVTSKKRVRSSSAGQHGYKRQMNRRELLQLGVLGSAAALTGARAEPKPAAFAWANASLRSLQEAMASGAVTSRGLCEQYLARIEAMNLKGPELRAILEVNPDALAIAEALDLER